MKKIYTLAGLFCSLTVFGQSQNVFSVEAYIAQIKQYHPIAKQAGILVDKANAELLAAKGSFDPVISYDASRKTFDGKNYYFYNNPEFKIPLPIGDIKTGVENNGGVFLSSENSIGRSSYFGFEVPLAKGLLIDKRRAALQQAKLFVNQSQQERLNVINNLLFEAYVAYWQWAGSYQLYNIYSKFLQVSNDRLRLIRIANVNGDRSLMDTLEAFTQVQNFQILQADALVKLNSSTFELNNYLWIEGDSAVQLNQNLQPDLLRFAANENLFSLEQVLATAMAQNPILRGYGYKLDILEVERKLKRQNLLPTLNAKAMVLNKDYFAFKNFGGALLENNNRLGIDFKIPIFLREGRGNYQAAKLKITETSLDVKMKRWEIENKIRNYYTEYTLLQNQLNIAQNAYDNYNLLLRNELLRFDNGESSLFLINTRENKVLEMMQKLIELRVKYFKARYAIEWSAGVLR
jgi:outer membrane protein TolC